ncbi:lactate utilization protein C [Metabacillus fastidiosus]|uniref:LutC/YkgG family protein n=1 Tax=Metabacillus fastidiosus TaxID=1458 RepID=UPI002E200D0B|nr:lactate utilization protein C [Metabacillus fastidiosus]
MTGQVYNREKFLNHLSEKMNRDRKKEHIETPVWSSNPQLSILKDASKEELVNILKKQCEIIHTQCIETTAEKLNEKVQVVFKQYGVSSAVTWKDERFFEYGLHELEVDIHVWNPKLKEKNIEIAEKADAGITFSDITLAESGTVVLFSNEHKGRSVSLLPKTYIAIIPKSSIVPRMTQAAEYIHEQVQKGEKISSCIDFITGPSNSADIELNLVVGVHGPVKATYIIVNNK